MPPSVQLPNGTSKVAQRFDKSPSDYDTDHISPDVQGLPSPYSTPNSSKLPIDDEIQAEAGESLSLGEDSQARIVYSV